MKLSTLLIFAALVFPGLVDAVEAPPATQSGAAELPRGFGIGTPEQMQNASQVWIDLRYLHRGLPETAIPEGTQRQLITVLTAATENAHELMLKAKEHPGGGKFDKEATELRARFDRQIAGIVTAAQILDWRDHSTIVFFEEMLLFNGPDAFLQETAPGLGLNVTEKQKLSLQPILDELGKATAKLMNSDHPTTDQEREVADNAVHATRDKMRGLLTVEQRQKWDQGVLEQIRGAAAPQK